MPKLYFTDLSSLSKTANLNGLSLALSPEERIAASHLGLVEGMPFILGDDGSYDHQINRFFRARRSGSGR